jgi:hypothetical protein
LLSLPVTILVAGGSTISGFSLAGCAIAAPEKINTAAALAINSFMVYLRLRLRHGHYRMNFNKYLILLNF